MNSAEGAIKIRSVRKGNVLILSLEGRLDALSSPSAETEILELIEQGSFFVVLDFNKLSYISSAGMRTLLTVSKKLKADNGKLVACCIQPGVMDVLKMTSFDQVLELAENEEEALKRF